LEGGTRATEEPKKTHSNGTCSICKGIFCRSGQKTFHVLIKEGYHLRVVKKSV